LQAFKSLGLFFPILLPDFFKYFAWRGDLESSDFCFAERANIFDGPGKESRSPSEPVSSLDSWGLTFPLLK
jgi:hypothetical protein